MFKTVGDGEFLEDVGDDLETAGDYAFVKPDEAMTHLFEWNWCKIKKESYSLKYTLPLQIQLIQ